MQAFEEYMRTKRGNLRYGAGVSGMDAEMLRQLEALIYEHSDAPFDFKTLLPQISVITVPFLMDKEHNNPFANHDAVPKIVEYMTLYAKEIERYKTVY